MMTHRILSFFQRLALTFWLGEMLFFIIIFAPRVFQVLARPDASKLQASIFPAYFTGGVVAGLVFLVMSLAIFSLRNTTAKDRWRYRFVLPLALLAWAVFIYSRWWITPEIDQLRTLILDPNVSPDIRSQFDALHALSVRINSVALLSLLGVLFLI